MTSQFDAFHNRIGQVKTKAMKLKNLAKESYEELEFFLKNTHLFINYQYHVLIDQPGHA